MNIDEADPQHEEVWDDSLLIDSWNQALQEYKKYHSIHASGGSIRDIKQAEAGSSKVDEALTAEESVNEPSTQTQDQHDGLPSKGAAAVDNVRDEILPKQTALFQGSWDLELIDTSSQTERQPGHNLNSIPSAFPSQAILGTDDALTMGKLPRYDLPVRDENLKKLLMSWYYAGYYTGLFEGQQQQPPGAQ